MMLPPLVFLPIIGILARDANACTNDQSGPTITEININTGVSRTYHPHFRCELMNDGGIRLIEEPPIQ